MFKCDSEYVLNNCSLKTLQSYDKNNFLTPNALLYFERDVLCPSDEYGMFLVKERTNGKYRCYVGMMNTDGRISICSPVFNSPIESARFLEVANKKIRYHEKKINLDDWTMLMCSLYSIKYFDKKLVLSTKEYYGSKIEVVIPVTW
jgi:hypothetical protein